jgi:hypothetical protein
MFTSTKYADIILQEFELNNENQIVRVNDGYLGRYKKGDQVKPFVTKFGYAALQMPKNIRNTVPFHHIVWMVHNQTTIPDGLEIDHIDGNRLNNHISNLRLVDRKLNNRNRKKRSDNTSGITGIRWSDYHQHYVIRRTIGNKRISRSRKTLPEAIEVLEQLKALGDGYTANHGQ